MINGVHHINLLVRNLEQAVEQYRRQLGVDSFQWDELPGRGVRMARFQAGGTWVVLVQPVADGEPMRVLREQGEGLFLLSFGVDSLDDAMERVTDGGGGFINDGPRQGLDNWRVIDLDPSCVAGAALQLTEEES